MGLTVPGEGKGLGVLPGAGQPGDRAQLVPTSSLPCRLCPCVGKGLGPAVVGVVYGHIDPAACQAGLARGEARAGQQAEAACRIYSHRKKSLVSKPVASSYEHANKYIPSCDRGTDILCLQKPAEPLL